MLAKSTLKCNQYLKRKKKNHLVCVCVCLSMDPQRAVWRLQNNFQKPVSVYRMGLTLKLRRSELVVSFFIH